MDLRFALSTLARGEARAGASRGLLAFCAVGFLVTLAVMSARGAGLDRWFFALLGWALFVYIPLRILLEAFQTIAPGMRRALVAQAEARPDRYRSRRSIELVVDGLFEREVVMPRIATPAQTDQAKAGAVAVLLQAGRPGRVGLSVAAARCLGTVERWTAELAAWSERAAPANIQARWEEVRALAALAAMTKVLVGAHFDQTGELLTPPDPARQTADGFLDACLDYCDRLSLEVDVVPWAEPALGLEVAPDLTAVARARWQAFCRTRLPALEARTAFVEAVTAR